MSIGLFDILGPITIGPSSSHTAGAVRIGLVCRMLLDDDIKHARITFYGSFADTYHGHGTDKAVVGGLLGFFTDNEKIRESLRLAEFRGLSYEIFTAEDPRMHPNTVMIEARTKDKSVRIQGASVGGGAIRDDETIGQKLNNVYPHTSMGAILEYTSAKRMLLWEYVEECEGADIWDYLNTVWQTMQGTMKRGLEKRGVLPGSLNLERKARRYLYKAENSPQYLRRMNNLFSYALACAEENAAGGVVVTAPTCGSCGVLPAVCRLVQEICEFEDNTILRALATASLFGNMAKANASISGAEVGCQGEVGVACAMAAAATCQLEGGDNRRIAYAAEMGLEHHLGLTCDPVDGLVQIPCIERNALAASRALDCATYALMSDGDNRVSYDDVLATMMQTGLDMSNDYRETSRGGLARFFKEKVLRIKGE